VGLCNGDVVSRINGYDLTSPDKALEVYEHMKGRSHFDLELTRAGSLQHLEVVIR
jgi:general secretion pathway protein C